MSISFSTVAVLQFPFSCVAVCQFHILLSRYIDFQFLVSRYVDFHLPVSRYNNFTASKYEQPSLMLEIYNIGRNGNFFNFEPFRLNR